MSENIKIKSTTTNGASHAFEFRGQIKWLAIGISAIAMSAIVAITVVSLRAIQQCSAPCYVEFSRKQMILAPAGDSVSTENRVLGTIPTPNRNPIAPLPATNVAPITVATLEAPKPVSKPESAAARQTSSKAAAAKPLRTASASPARKPTPKPATLTKATPASERLHRVIWQTIDRS
jgi:hypothetical protein